MTEVVLVGVAIVVDALGKDENVVAETERIGENRYGLQVDVRVVAGGLASGGTIEVPDGKIIRSVAALLLVECLFAGDW